MNFLFNLQKNNKGVSSHDWHPVTLHENLFFTSKFFSILFCFIHGFWLTTPQMGYVLVIFLKLKNVGPMIFHLSI